jgi:hypothetical protein
MNAKVELVKKNVDSAEEKRSGGISSRRKGKNRIYSIWNFIEKSS